MIITDRMTIEEIMVLFNEEYGDDFNWHLIPFSDHSLEMELRKELSVSDDFFKGKVYSVAKCDSNDDVLFLSEDGCWRIYHLTYTTNNMVGYPKYEEFGSRREAAEYIQEQFKKEFL